jgi:hypothetical protein
LGQGGADAHQGPSTIELQEEGQVAQGEAGDQEGQEGQRLISRPTDCADLLERKIAGKVVLVP